MKPVYFDLSVSDLGAARTFFSAVLGWTFERFEMPYAYYRIRAGADDEPGIDGGIGRVADAPLAEGRPLTVVTVPVRDLRATLALVEANGGRVLEPATRIAGVGLYSTCAEPGGLRFGLIEPKPGSS